MAVDGVMQDVELPICRVSMENFRAWQWASCGPCMVMACHDIDGKRGCRSSGPMTGGNLGRWARRRRYRLEYRTEAARQSSVLSNWDLYFRPRTKRTRQYLRRMCILVPENRCSQAERLVEFPRQTRTWQPRPYLRPET